MVCLCVLFVICGGLSLVKTKTMEENSSLFSVSIDTTAKSHLSDAAKWARFLAITGMVLLGFVLIRSIYSIVRFNQITSLDSYRGSRPPIVDQFTAGTIAGTLLVVIVPFFALLFALRFANALRRALNASNQEILNLALQNLKLYFRYLGIITIILAGILTVGWIVQFGRGGY